MGGKAIVGAERMTAEQYKRLVQHIGTILAGFEHRATYALANKASYGDLDVVVCGGPADRKDIVALLQPEQERSNGDTLSLGVRVDGHLRQVDVSFVSPGDRFCAVHAFKSYGVFGVCVNVALSRAGLAFAPEGLRLRIPTSDAVRLVVVLSTDLNAIMDFLGVDLSVFNAGFEDEAALCAYLLTSPWIREHFPVLLRHKEPRVQAFLSAVRAAAQDLLLPYSTAATGDASGVASGGHRDDASDDASSDSAPAVRDQDEAGGSRCSAYRERVQAHALAFFDKQAEYDTLLQRQYDKKAIAAKFNGELVQALTGLEGRALGVFIKRFRASHSDAELLRMSRDGIARAIAACGRAWDLPTAEPLPAGAVVTVDSGNGRCDGCGGDGTVRAVVIIGVT